MPKPTKPTRRSTKPALPVGIRVGFIPDLSVAHLYLSVVQDLAGEPDQLAVWCAIAVYAPFDEARRQSATTQEWLERTKLPMERLLAAWRALTERSLIARDGIPGGLLRLESLERAHPYCDYLRNLENPRSNQTEMEFGEHH
jgi:hypothetical protein